MAPKTQGWLAPVIDCVFKLVPSMQLFASQANPTASTQSGETPNFSHECVGSSLNAVNLSMSK